MLTRDIGGTCRDCATTIGAHPNFYEPSGRIGGNRLDTFQGGAIGKYDEDEIAGWLDKFTKTGTRTEDGKWITYAGIGAVALLTWWILQ